MPAGIFTIALLTAPDVVEPDDVNVTPCAGLQLPSCGMEPTTLMVSAQEGTLALKVTAMLQIGCGDPAAAADAFGSVVDVDVAAKRLLVAVLSVEHWS